MKYPGEKLGISIRGGAKGHPGNPLDPKDEGIFISKVSSCVLMYVFTNVNLILPIFINFRSTKVVQRQKTRDFMLVREYLR